MSWHYVDDAFPEHPKWIELEANPRLWSECMALWLAAGCYCRRQSSEGFVPSTRLTRLTPLPAKRAEAAAEALVRVGLWVSCDGGYRFHDWEDYDWRRDDAPDEGDDGEGSPRSSQRNSAAERARRYRERKKRERHASRVTERDGVTPESVTESVTRHVTERDGQRDDRHAPSPQTPHPHVTQSQAKPSRVRDGERDGERDASRVTERDDQCDTVPQITHQDPSVIVAESYRTGYRERFGVVAPRLHFSDTRVSELVRLAKEQAEIEGSDVYAVIDRFFTRFWPSESAARLRHQPGAMQALFSELMARPSAATRGPAPARDHSEFHTTTDAELEEMFG